VDDGDGRAIWNDAPSYHQAVTPATAYLMSSMLADVIGSGTATTARAAGFKLPAAGKTGTADNYTDAWFIGYTPHLVAGVWFGMDRPTTIMNRGFASIVAVPAWADFMKRATANDAADWFSPPPDVERVAICRLSGMLATDACRRGWTGADYAQAGLSEMPGQPIGTTGRLEAVKQDRHDSTVYEDYFPIGTAPTEPCPIHGAVQTIPGATGSPASTAADASMSSAALAPASYRTSATAVPGVQRVVGADGRVTWVIR